MNYIEKNKRARKIKRAYRDEVKGKKVDYLTEDEKLEYEKNKKYIKIAYNMQRRSRNNMIFGGSIIGGIFGGEFFVSNLAKTERYDKGIVLLLLFYFILFLVYLFVGNPKYYGTRVKHNVIKVLGVFTLVVMGFTMILQAELYNLLVFNKGLPNMIYTIGLLLVMFSFFIIGLILYKRVIKTKDKVLKEK